MAAKAMLLRPDSRRPKCADGLHGRTQSAEAWVPWRVGPAPWSLPVRELPAVQCAPAQQAQECRGESGWCSDMTSTHGVWRHTGVRFLLSGAAAVLPSAARRRQPPCHSVGPRSPKAGPLWCGDTQGFDSSSPALRLCCPAWFGLGSRHAMASPRAATGLAYCASGDTQGFDSPSPALPLCCPAWLGAGSRHAVASPRAVTGLA